MFRLKATFSQRFIVLTLVGYLLAVGVAAFAVSIGANPILKQLQDQTIRENAEAKANAVRIALREFALKTKLLAENPNLVKIAVGDDLADQHAFDYLDSFSSFEGLLKIHILDFQGVGVFEYGFGRNVSTTFLGFERRDVARILLQGSGPEFIFSYRPGRAEDSHNFLVAQPIRQNGLIEGVLVSEVTFDISKVFEEKTSIGTATLLTGFQHQMMSDWRANTEYFAVPVPETDFYISLLPDRDAIAAAGDEIVNSVLYAVGLFLVFPFSMMCLAGLRSIVGPHKALQASKAALSENQQKLSELADIAQRSNDAIVATDMQGRITWVNQAFTNSTGYCPEEVLGKSPGAVLQGPGTDQEERKRIAKAVADAMPIRSEILNYCKDGRPYWNALSIAPQLDQNGKPYRFVAISTDITEKKQAQDDMLAAKAAIEHQANHDPLTGLPNRRALDEALERIKNENAKRVLIRIDLDHFKNVNDTLGHAAGDHVLEFVSDLLMKHVRKSDMAARVGGDEFVILMGDDATHDDATCLAERLLENIQQEIPFEDKVCRVGASFGVASASQGLLDNKELLLGADSALYVAKELGRNRVVSYTDQLHESVVASRIIAKEIEGAIKRNEFEPFFQPQFDAQTFEFVGMEALVRWRHPSRGILPPAAFLEIAEQLSVVGDLDKMVFDKGLMATARLNKLGCRIPKVSFNVVASRLEEPDIPELAHTLTFEGTKISFEVLESVLVEEQSELFRSRVELLREIGFGIEVDDFGSGHASIIGLTHLLPDTMKIDQRLVFPVTSSPTALKMVGAVVEIARALGIKITAEGVETEMHANLLAEAGCDVLQGYYFAKPMSADDLITFLENHDPASLKKRCLAGTDRQRVAG